MKIIIMKKYIFMKKTIFTIFLVSGAFEAFAAPNIGGSSVISVSGNIVSTPCLIKATDLTQIVDLGDVLVPALSAGTFKPVNFSFNIYGCDSTLTSAKAVVTGTAADSDAPGYGTAAVLSNTGTATGVAVGLLGSTSVTSSATGTLKLGQTSAALTLISDGNGAEGGVLNLGAQIVPVTSATPATAGTVVSTATITFTYS